MKKLALILGTAGAAVLLAGGVVAAYVINDKANNTGIIISPGEIVDDKTGTVTLDWGEMAGFYDIDDLKAGTPAVRTVVVKASVEDENGAAQGTVYRGKLDVELKDLSGKTPEAIKLVDYLTVSVKGYKYTNGDFEGDKSVLGSITPDGESKISVSIYANAAGIAVDFEVSLDVAATPVMSQINGDSVYLAVDWNRGDVGEGVKRVYIPDNGWENMYVYSYSDGTQNKEWPGVKLERDPQTGLFVADLLAHDYFIFNDGGSNQYPAAGAEGMSATSLNYNVAAKIYFDWDQHTFVAEEPVTLAPFYLLGETTVWDIRAENGFELRDDDKPEGATHQWFLQTEIGDDEVDKEFKLRNDHGNLWLGFDSIEAASKTGVDGKAALIDEGNGGNFKFHAKGTYDIYLKQYGDNWQIFVAKEGAQGEEPAVELAPYYLLGGESGWDVNSDFAFVLKDEDKPEGVLHQYFLTVDFTAEQAALDYKIRNGNGSTWLGFECIEAISAYGDVEHNIPALIINNAETGNFKFNGEGKYDIYIKEYADSYGVYVGKQGAIAPSQLAPYYLVGDATDWGVAEDFGLEAVEHEGLQGQWHIRYTVTELQVTGETTEGFKLRSADGSKWFGINEVEAISKDGDANAEPAIAAVVAAFGEEGNFKFLAAGTYDIYLKQGNDNGFSVYIGAYVAPQA